LALAALLTVGFLAVGSGRTLLCTFVPGMAFVVVNYLVLHRRKRELPEPRRIWPLYFTALAVQLAHFVEEYATGLPARFPAIYGRAAYPDEFFVVFNLLAYVVFAVAAQRAFVEGIRPMLVPALFFVCYGTLGNAVAHTFWVLWYGAYFPGFYSAQVYWILAPLLLRRIHGDWRTAFEQGLGFVAVLVPILIAGLEPAAG